MGKRASVCKFPVARIKKIMQANEEVGKVSAATPVAISKALELFMEHIISESVEEARSKNSKKITAYHLKRAVHHHEAFDFLKDIVSKVPDPAEKESVNEGDNRGGKRRKVSGNADAPSAGESSTLQGAPADGGDAAPSLIRGGQSTAPKEEYDEEEGEEDEED